MLQTVQVAHDDQQVRRRLDRQEASAGNIHTDRSLEVLDRGTDSSLQLNDVQAIV